MTFHPSKGERGGWGRGKTALVTGGSGFIGHHLVGQLLDESFQVRILDIRDRAPVDPRADFIRGSILDRALVRDSLSGVDVLFHLAADPNLWAPNKRDHFLMVNTEGTVTVLEEARRARTERIVYTSTESILKGRRAGKPGILDENLERSLSDMPGPYCRSKFLAEQAALEAARDGLPVVVVNPTLPIGPGDRGPTPPTQMLLDFLNGKNPAFLDFEMNMIDVRDAALGHLLAARHGRPGERYILGGENLLLSQVLLILREVTGLAMPRTRIPYGLALAVAAVSETMADFVTRKPPKASLTGVRIAGAEMVFDCAKARRELGLNPRSARAAITEAVAWFLAEGLLERKPLRDTSYQGDPVGVPS